MVNFINDKASIFNLNPLEIKIIGKFGILLEEGEECCLLLHYENNPNIILNFSECDIINMIATPICFADIKNCCIKNIKIFYSKRYFIDDLNKEYYLLKMDNVILDNCFIMGKIRTNLPTLITCININNSKINNVNIDISITPQNYNPDVEQGDYKIYGIKSLINDYIYDTIHSYIYNSTLKIEFETENENNFTASVYGISGKGIDCIGDTFEIKGNEAFGGCNGGLYNSCTFISKGIQNGYGFYCNEKLLCSNCTFKGYVLSQEGKGVGIYGGNNSNLLLNNIFCPEENKIDYHQTNSMKILSEGKGFYTGIFYEPPALDGNEMLTYTDFVPNKIMMQSQYDEITPVSNILYTLTEG